MKPINITEMYEQATETERHQFLAGVDRFIKIEANKLSKQRAEAERKIELGEDNVTK